MFRDVRSRVNFPALEEQVLAFWKERDIFKKSVENRRGGPEYVFYEGPPTANGRPGVHHVLARVFKDLFPRYKTMRGYYSERKGGWDTHGLPVELEVEKELGLATKREIEAFGIAEFNARCRESVFRYVNDWEAMTDRIGFWVDMDDPYVTFHNSYIESGWWIIKQLWDAGLIYRDYKVTPHCPRCGTSLSSHEVALGYDETSDPSVYVRFRLRPGQASLSADLTTALAGETPVSLLVWTTTPWTLPANVATAINREAEYALVGVGGQGPGAGGQGDQPVATADSSGSAFSLQPSAFAELLVLARARVADVVPGGEVVATFRGADLLGLHYEPLFPGAGGQGEGRRAKGEESDQHSSIPALQHSPDSAFNLQPSTSESGGRSSVVGRPAWRVVAGDMVSGPMAVDDEPAKPFVSLDDGTGIVHIAPAYGAIDLEVGRAEGLPVLHTVDLKGDVTGVDPAFDGLFVKDADPVIIQNLDDRGILWRSERIEHRYPFCWRCRTPLLYFAKASWYIRTTARKDRLLAGNEAINWYPEHIKHGRFGNWLANNIDWAFSRERYWGTPIPIWHCESCNHYQCVGSVAELRQKSEERRVKSEREDTPIQPSAFSLQPSEELDLHRPYIDEVTLACEKCGGEARRIPEVCDAWFDSGAMPVAQWHYPFEHKETFRSRFPADFICEGIDQTRGWFYTLHAESTLLFDGPSFKNVVCLGLILDGKGEKMSKSRGNVVDPWDILRVQGADALRWYLYTASPPGNARRFSAELVDEALRKFLLTLWNTYSFFVTYANLDGWVPGAGGQGPGVGDQGGNAEVLEFWNAHAGSSHVIAPAEYDQNQHSSASAFQHSPSALDRWIIALLNQTVADVTRALDGYDPTEAGRAIEGFVDNLSNWYVRRSRRRFWKSESDADKRSAYLTLHECLVTVAKLLAPMTPFVAEEIYQNLIRTHDQGAPESVHSSDFPVVNEALIDRRLLDDVALVMQVVGLGRAARSKASLRVRQPLATLYVRPKSPLEEDALRRLADQIQDELNIKEVVVVHDAGDLFDYNLKPRFDVLGPRLGREVGKIGAALKSIDAAAAVAVWQGGGTVEVAGHQIGGNDVIIAAVERSGVVSAEENGYVVGIATELTPDLIAEGQARELVHRIQTMRRAAGYEIADRITIRYQGDADLGAVLERFADWVQAETLAVALESGAPEDGSHVEDQTIGPATLTIAVRRMASTEYRVPSTE